MIFAVDNEPWILVPTGFVLSKRVLLTVRFAKSIACEKVVKELSGADEIDPAFAFVRLLEELVDRVADLLEGTVGDLDEASQSSSGRMRKASALPAKRPCCAAS